MNYLQEPFVYPIDIIPAAQNHVEHLADIILCLKDLWGELMNATTAAIAKSEYAHNTGPECLKGNLKLYFFFLKWNLSIQ